MMTVAKYSTIDGLFDIVASLGAALSVVLAGLTLYQYYNDAARPCP